MWRPAAWNIAPPPSETKKTKKTNSFVCFLKMWMKITKKTNSFIAFSMFAIKIFEITNSFVCFLHFEFLNTSQTIVYVTFWAFLISPNRPGHHIHEVWEAWELSKWAKPSYTGARGSPREPPGAHGCSPGPPWGLPGHLPGQASTPSLPRELPGELPSQNHTDHCIRLAFFNWKSMKAWFTFKSTHFHSAII